MNRLVSKSVLALVVGAMLLAASPASAFVAVACTARNSAGKVFRDEHFGLFEFDSKISAASYAMDACQAKSARPASCAIKECHVTQW